MQKDKLRKKQLTYLKERDHKNDDFINFCVSQLSEFRKAKTVALFVSMPHEISTGYLFDICSYTKKQIVLPVITGEHEMQFYVYDQSKPLIKSQHFNVYEPDPNECKAVDGKEIDLMVLPGLAYDKHLNRLGYGKGFYDNYLKNYPNIFKVGIADHRMMVKYIETNPDDIAVNMVVLDNEIKEDLK